jgi:hypothetical protein
MVFSKHVDVCAHLAGEAHLADGEFFQVAVKKRITSKIARKNPNNCNIQNELESF